MVQVFPKQNAQPNSLSVNPSNSDDKLTPLAAEDELPHPPGADALWNESWYWNFASLNSQIAGFTRIGRSPNRGITDGLLLLHLPGGEFGFVRVLSPFSSDTSITCQGLKYKIVEPMHRWQLTYKGRLFKTFNPNELLYATHLGGIDLPQSEVELKLEIELKHLPFNYPKYSRIKDSPPGAPSAPAPLLKRLQKWAAFPHHVVQALRMRDNKHYEQSTSISGLIRVDGQVHTINGNGHRDHSWGIRDWSAPSRWVWCTGNIDNNLAFNVFHIAIAGSNACNGYVWDGEKCQLLKTIRIDATFPDDIPGARTVTLTLTTSDGKTLRIDGDVHTRMPLSIIDEGFASTYTIGQTRWYCDGREGTGVAEFLERRFP